MSSSYFVKDILGEWETKQNILQLQGREQLSPTEASSFAGIVHALSKHHFHAERRYRALKDANFGLCAYEEKKAFFPGSRMVWTFKKTTLTSCGSVLTHRHSIFVPFLFLVLLFSVAASIKIEIPPLSMLSAICFALLPADGARRSQV